MEDNATIRYELQGLAERRLETPSGHLSVSLADLASSGIETDAAARWAEAHGGYVDRRASRRYGRLVVPTAALRE
jgi:hypothetical protein